MNNITICFYGIGNNPLCQAEVKIYDKCDLIYCGKTKCGKINVCLKSNRAYRLKASILSNNINTPFNVFNDTCNLNFGVNNCNNIRNISFTLTDSYYGLPIERGELILWQRQ
mgnify:CR=1 FL=1